MRLKYVEGAKERIERSAYVIKNPENYKHQFHQLFQNSNPIHIEIGMGKGDFIIENAIRYPNINFIGIERYDSVIVRAIEKLELKTLTNIKLIRINADMILELFDQEIDLIYLNFSDPWPKDRHAKRRLSSPFFLEKYDHIFKDKKRIVMKTDNRYLFEYSLMTFTQHGYKITDISLNLHAEVSETNIETEYEKKFVEKGFPIYKVEIESD